MLLEGVAIGVGFIPVLGELFDLINVLTGKDQITGAELGPFEQFATLALLLVPFLNARNGKWILALGQRVLDLLKSLMKKVGEWITWYGQAVSNDLKALWSKLEEVSQKLAQAVNELYNGPQYAYATGSGGGPRPNPGGRGPNPPRGGGPTDTPPTSTGIVDNISSFFKSGFGKLLGDISQRTNARFQGQVIYKTTDKLGDYIKKGDHFYLDNLHKDHLEVFDSRGAFKYVLNLDGTLNEAKSAAARGRSIKDLL